MLTVQEKVSLVVLEEASLEEEASPEVEAEEAEVAPSKGLLVNNISIYIQN